jgi:hypothetical protein
MCARLTAQNQGHARRRVTHVPDLSAIKPCGRGLCAAWSAQRRVPCPGSAEEIKFRVDLGPEAFAVVTEGVHFIECPLASFAFIFHPRPQRFSA